MGQTRLAEPAQVLPEVLTRIREVADETTRVRLLTALASFSRSNFCGVRHAYVPNGAARGRAGSSNLDLLSLLNNEEALERVEKMVEAADELLDTPYLRRIRQQGREEGLIEGHEAGLAEGREAGLLEGLREAILETITVRFDPAASEYRRVSQQLAGLTHREQLQQLLTVAVQAEDMAAFAARLAAEL